MISLKESDVLPAGEKIRMTHIMIRKKLMKAVIQADARSPRIRKYFFITSLKIRLREFLIEAKIPFAH